MEQLDKEPEDSSAEEDKRTETLLKAMNQQFENLHQNLIVQLNQDVERLQSEKSRLLEEIEQLHSQRQQQINRPQQLVQQLAQVLANQLEEQLTQQLHQIANKALAAATHTAGEKIPSASTVKEYQENAQQLVAALETSIKNSFKTLQEEINAHQSTLSQQLARMRNLEKQGELIVESLVKRLNRELEEHSIPQHHPLPIPPKPQKQVSNLGLGSLLVLLSTIALSIHHIVVKVISTESNVFGFLPVGGFIPLNLGNSLLLLWIRMLVVLPIMAAIATILHPPVWGEFKQLFKSLKLASMLNIVGSSSFLFLSQVLLYMAIGQISPGIAVAIVFMYPVITVPLGWIVLRDRPRLLQILILLGILLGGFLAASPSLGVGVATAVGSGVSFALYLILIQRGLHKLHPVSLSFVQFLIILILASLSLLLPFQIDVTPIPTEQQGLVAGGILLGILTIVGYLLNHLGTKRMGAKKASLLASATPMFTAILAILMIPEAEMAWGNLQLFGVLLISLGLFSLICERPVR